METMKYPTANPMVIHRRELDNWAVLFDPDTNETYALDPIASVIWEKLDGAHNNQAILEEIAKVCENGIPEEAATDLEDFLKQLEEKALIGKLK